MVQLLIHQLPQSTEAPGRAHLHHLHPDGVKVGGVGRHRTATAIRIGTNTLTIVKGGAKTMIGLKDTTGGMIPRAGAAMQAVGKAKENDRRYRYRYGV